MGLSLAFRYAAAPEEGAAAGFVSSGPSFTEDLDPQWRTSLPRRLADLVEAWERPVSWEGTSTIAGNVMPNHQVAMVALDELVLHGLGSGGRDRSAVRVARGDRSWPFRVHHRPGI
ncbi:TIGR03086 family protein [Mycobacteroides abscessus subsp. abscessus]|nr:TIGR03086 family protein [Mycobacteroides abscessus subsp. abscessus]